MVKSRNKNFDPEKFFKNSRNQINNIMMKLRFLIDGDDLPTKLSNYVLLIPLFIYLECLIKNKNLIKRNNTNILSMNDSNYKNLIKKK